MKPRSAAWYIREVKKRIITTPTDPVRLDIPHADAEALWQAFKKGGHELHGILHRQVIHIDAEKAKEGIERVAFFGVEYKHPQPVKTIPVKDNAAADRLTKRLLKSESGDFVVHPAWRGQHVVEVWQAWDYIARDTKAWSGRELASFADTVSDGILLYGMHLIAEKGMRWGTQGNDHIERMNAEKKQKAKERHNRIREHYAALLPQIESGSVQVKKQGGAYDIIRGMMETEFDDLRRPGYGWRPSDATIDRALDKKK